MAKLIVIVFCIFVVLMSLGVLKINVKFITYD